MRYSQNDEEDYILRFFEAYPPGHFLDIGAYNGKELSNTYALAQRDWSGVLIEPDPFNFQELFSLYGANDKMTLINAALVPDSCDALVPFYRCGAPFLSKLNATEADLEKWQKAKLPYARFYVSTLGVRQFGVTMEWSSFDFISIDVEGGNLALLAVIPIKHCSKLRLICVEYDAEGGRVEALLEPYGFVTLARNNENLILVRALQP